jgi:spermidine/putrescine transport system ATP-binding protein
LLFLPLTFDIPRSAFSLKVRAPLSQPDIEVRSVTRRFGDFVAVSNISLTVEAGEFLTLLGPSGCGKTTLLRMIAGFETPDEGCIMLGGEDVTALPPYRRNVHTVFQHYALFPHLTVARNIAFGLEQKRKFTKTEISKKVAAAMDMVELDDLGERYPRQLSGGQQQRVAIARALVCEPRVLLLDEPLGALDQKLRRQMQIELKSLQRRTGISFVFVTHDQEEALTMSDRIAVLNKGKIEQLAAPRELYERPRTEFTASFIGTCNLLRGTVCACKGDVFSMKLADGVVEIPITEGLAVGSSVTLAVRPEKIVLSNDAAVGLGGIVREQVYLGDTTHWYVELSDGQRVTVFAPNDGHAATEMFRVGASVKVGWSSVSGVVVASGQ